MFLFMYKANILLLLCIAICTQLSNAFVNELTDNNFQSSVSQVPVALVMFYAPWCGHCKRLKPKFYEASTVLSNKFEKIRFMTVDCTGSGKKTCQLYKITGYPTMKIFRNGKYIEEYSGPRETKELVRYMKAQIGPSSRELRSVDDLKDFLSVDKDFSLVGYFDKDEQLKSAYMDAADKMRGKFRFAHTTDEAVLENQRYRDQIVLYRPNFLCNKFETNNVTYADSGNSSDIINFIYNKMHGLVGYRTIDNLEQFTNPLVVAYYNTDYQNNIKSTNYWRNRVLNVAQNYSDKINFAISPADDFTHDLNDFGIMELENRNVPIVVARDKENQRYIMDEIFSVNALQKFVVGVLEEKLIPYMKSTEVPEDNKSPLKIIVGSTFIQEVLKNDKDTFLLLYSPNCLHCKEMLPTYTQLAVELKDEDVLIALIDSTNNDVPDAYAVKDYPTIYWASKNDKRNPIIYGGKRTLKEFIAFIAKHSTDGLKEFNMKGKRKATKIEL